MLPRLTTLCVYVYLGQQIPDPEQPPFVLENDVRDITSSDSLDEYAADHACLTELRIRAVYYRNPGNRFANVDFPMNNHHLRCLLSALRFPSIETVNLRLKVSNSIEGARGRLNLMSVLNACDGCYTPALKEASLRFDLIPSNSPDSDTDVSVVVHCICLLCDLTNANPGNVFFRAARLTVQEQARAHWLVLQLRGLPNQNP